MLEANVGNCQISIYGNCQKFLKCAQKVKIAPILMRPKKKMRPATSQKRPLCAIAQRFSHTGPAAVSLAFGKWQACASVVKSFESEDATILPKSATKGATPEICKKAPSKIFDDVFFRKEIWCKKAPKLGAKAPKF